MFKFISYQKEYTCFKVTLTKIAKIRALKYDSNNKIIFYRHVFHCLKNNSINIHM